MNKELYNKHASKLLKGFNKQCCRQDKKEENKTIELKKAIDIPLGFKGIYTHTIEVTNSKWNGMNLKKLRNKLHPLTKYNGMYSKFYKRQDGKIVLSRYGKELLKKRKSLNNND